MFTTFMRNNPERSFSNPNYKPTFEINADPKNSIGRHVIDASNKVFEQITIAEKNSFIDVMTGCYNRNFFENFKDKKFNPENDDNDIGLVFADINYLKITNDTQGHHKGDDLIRKAPEFLKLIFGKNDIVVRYGGDEFVVICFNDTNNNKFEEDLSSRLSEAIKKSPVSMAIGVAVYDKELDHADLGETCDRASRIMQGNKEITKSAR